MTQPIQPIPAPAPAPGLDDNQFDRLAMSIVVLTGLVIVSIVVLIAFGHASEMPSELPAAIPSGMVGLVGLYVQRR